MRGIHSIRAMPIYPLTLHAEAIFADICMCLNVLLNQDKGNAIG